MDDIKQYLNSKDVKYFVCESKHEHHPIELAKQLSKDNKDKKIICVGGDGTVHEVLNGIVNFEHVHLGIIPAGSGNDFISSIEQIKGKSVHELLDMYLTNKWEYADYISINNDKVRAMNSFGFGIDTYIIKKFNRMKHFSPETRYKIANITQSLFFHVNKVQFSIDDGKTWSEVKTIIFTICNGGYMGSGLNICNTAKINDKLLSISYIGKFNRLTTIYNLMKLLKKGAHTIKTTKFLECKEIKVKLDQQFYECDGEFYTDTKDIEAKVVSNKLKLLI